MKPKSKLFAIVYGSFLWLLCNAAYAQTTYYVSTSGNDTNLGTSAAAPWKTLAKINASTFASGDFILLKRGETFVGKLIIKNSGITIDAYGAGNNPIISGSEKITSTWTVSSGNIWETTFSSNKPAAVNNFFNGPNKLPISRHPNKTINHGYFNFETHSGLNQITDNQLGTSPNWAGSEMVLRSERWRLNRVTVSSHSGNTLIFPVTTGVDNVRDGYGYFFVNDLKAIDTEGEWAYKAAAGKLYVYSTTDPNTKSMYFPRSDTTLYVNSASNVSIKNIDIRYSGKFAVYLKSSAASLIEGVNVTDCGGDGVYYTACVGGTFQNCSIRRVNGTGFFSNGSSSQLAIKNNVVSDIGDEAFAKSKTFIGIDCNSPNSEVSGNLVSKTGYSGIISAGLNNLVKRNVVDSACLSLEDMGGIYTNYNVGANSGMVIEENIVTNSIGEMLGAPGDYSKANGIYVDNMSTGVTVRNNTVAFIRGTGLFANANRTGNQFLNNTSYSSGFNEFSIYKPVAIPNYVVNGNLLVSTSLDSNFNVLNSDHTEEFTLAEMGTYTGNYIINPFNTKAVYMSYKDNTVQKIKRYTPYEWEVSADQVNGTIPAPIRYPAGTIPADVIKFFYNKTSTALSITLPPGLYIDAKNQAYCSTATVQPFQSLILFRKDLGSCVTPGACAAPIHVNIDSLTDNAAVLRWNRISGSLNYDIRYRAEADTIWKYAHNITDTTVTLLGLKAQTYYQYELRTSCYGTESTWLTNPVFRTGQAVPQHVFVNANLSNCGPSTAFAAVHSDTDNKWTLQNSGGIGSVDKDIMRSSSFTENAPEITMTVPGVLDPCGVYDIYLYYVSPSTQPWKTQARLSTSPTLVIYDRNTPGAELLADNTGTTASNRLYRAKLGTVSGSTDFSVVIDDINYGPSSSRSVFDGVGYLKIAEGNPVAPDSLKNTSVSPTKIGLSWRDLATNETAYVIERKTGSGAFSILATLPANTTTYEDILSAQDNYTYRVYAKNGDCISTFSNQVNVDNSSLTMLKTSSEGDKLTLKAKEPPVAIIYPNPSAGVFTVQLLKSKQAYSVKVRSMYGQLILDKTVRSQEEQITIDLSPQLAGIYLLDVSTESINQHYKLLKQ